MSIKYKIQYKTSIAFPISQRRQEGMSKTSRTLISRAQAAWLNIEPNHGHD